MMQSQRLSPIALFIAAGLLSGCQSPPPGMNFDHLQFKGVTSAPATPSVQQAYNDIFDEMWADSKEIVEADRFLHGVRPAIATAPPVASADKVSFDRYQSLYFKVYVVEVVDQYKTPVSLNYSDHLLVTPNDAVHEWAGRLRPTGGVNKLQVVITDARVTPASDHQHYDASLAIEMRICSRDGTVLSRVASSSVQSIAFSEANRNAALNAMLLKLIDNANGELESKIAKDFSPFIDRAKAV